MLSYFLVLGENKHLAQASEQQNANERMALVGVPCLFA